MIDRRGLARSRGTGDRGGRWWRRNGLALALLAPTTLLLVAFIVVPAFSLLWTALTDYSPGLDPNFVGIRNFVSLVDNPSFQVVAIRNIAYVVVVVSLQLLVGLGIAILLDNQLPLRALWMAILIAPFAVSPIVAVVSWKYLLDPSYGLANYIFSVLGLPSVPWLANPVTSMIAVVIVAVWKGFPFIAIILFAALRSVPVELKEAARIDGASTFQIFWSVKLPLIVPAISIVALFETIFAVREFDIIQTMTGGGPGGSTALFSHYLYRTAFGNFDFGMGAAVGWIMLAVTLVLAFAIIWRTYKNMYDTQGSTK
ncbi:MULTISPECIES: sugar ABC transporter permease [unclassified Chelatococcus]|uniref:carbohydrate ABC transporter permease n=1 Tax=unclassified Chelatococcus TaxID=2638111 RepID=UPI001BCA83E9|nr:MULTISPECIES: sugar ABC transporter permease [unclassified Chelatococcus]MBS7701613.1 sugar ABC transporter permease [Chelatococcus sp. YT9]MBX3559683.1 sugar ABC transporter permease [Chelatococcus sp.]